MPHFLRDFRERQYVSFDHAQARPRPQLAAEQAYGLEIRVHVVRAAGDEADDMDALEGRDVECRLNGRFDRNLVAGDAGHQGDSDERATYRRCGSTDH